MVVNMIVAPASARAGVHRCGDEGARQVANAGELKDSIRGVLDDAVKNTFSSTDMTTYNAILKQYGCASGAACEATLAQTGRGIGQEADRATISSCLHRRCWGSSC